MISIMLSQILGQAASRCTEIADSEEVMGYPDSAETYREMSGELRALIPWVYRCLAARHTQDLEDEGVFIRG